MDTKLLRSLTESYYEIYETQVEENEVIVENEIEPYDVVLAHLLDEGLAGSVEDAETIMGAMSAEWIQGIVEQDLTARQKYLVKKVDDMNAESPGSAHKYVSGKQGAGAALDRANRSAMQMRGV
jgi:hypothetical protein